MSFGFSVGDLIGAANLTYRLIAALRENHDAGEEYRSAIDELGCYQTALMKVSYLGRNNNVPRDTFDAASHMVMQSMDMIQSYLDQTKKYDQKLGRDASGFRSGFRKVRWTLIKADDMKKLRDSLQRRNAGLQLLLQCAGFETDNAPPKYVGDVRQMDSVPSPITRNGLPDHNKDSATGEDVPVGPSAGLHGNASSSSKSVGNPPTLPGVTEPTTLPNVTKSSTLPDVTEDPSILPNIIEPPTSQLFSLSSFSAEQLRSLISDQASREHEIRTLSTLLRTLVKLGDYQLKDRNSTDFLTQLDSICDYSEVPKLSSSIKFKDAVGRKFSFPWRLAQTWKGMEELIKQAFLHVDVIGPHVHEGHYDLVGPDGEIILPQVWETLIQPGWLITMHMWPMPEPPPPAQPEVFPYPPLPPPPLRKPKSKRRSQAPSAFFKWAAGGAGSPSKRPASSPAPHTPPSPTASAISLHGSPPLGPVRLPTAETEESAGEEFAASADDADPFSETETGTSRTSLQATAESDDESGDEGWVC